MADSDHRVRWCLGQTATGERRLKVANVRGHAMTLEYTPGLTLLGTPRLMSRLPALATMTSRPGRKGTRVTVIDAGEQLEFAVAGAPRQQAVTVRSSVGDTSAPPSASGSTPRRSSSPGAARPARAGSPPQVARGIDLATCGPNIVADRTADVAATDDARRHLRSSLGVAFGCLGWFLGEAGAREPVVSGISWLGTGIQTTLDTLGPKARAGLAPSDDRIRFTHPADPRPRTSRGIGAGAFQKASSAGLERELTGILGDPTEISEYKFCEGVAGGPDDVPWWRVVRWDTSSVTFSTAWGNKPVRTDPMTLIAWRVDTTRPPGRRVVLPAGVPWRPTRAELEKSHSGRVEEVIGLWRITTPAGFNYYGQQGDEMPYLVAGGWNPSVTERAPAAILGPWARTTSST